MDAAVAIGDADGLGAVSLSAIAARLGCTPPSLYTHVASLNDLFEALTTRCTGELADQLRDAVMGRSGEDGIRAFAQAWREYAWTFPNRYAAVWLASESENKSRTDVASIGIRAEGCSPVPGYSRGDSTHGLACFSLDVAGFRGNRI